MFSRLDLRGNGRDLRAKLARPRPESDPDTVGAVRQIVAAVAEGGDAAVRRLTLRFDGFDPDPLLVPKHELTAALRACTPAFRRAMEFASAQIAAYHETQRETDVRHEREGVVVRSLVRPVDRAGLYVPGGRAAYPSTVLMTAIPAQVAGVRDVALCVPGGSDGRVPAPTLAAAALCGVEEVYRVGGAQAIAALAHGTETVRPVDVVVGPGNLYVTLAKREVAGLVGIEAAAGPSELVIVADDSTPPFYVAVDLVAQAEHGPHGAAYLVTWSEPLAAAVEQAAAELTATSTRRAEVEATLREGGRIILVDGPEQALEVSNAVAPEHLELLTTNPEALLDSVRNAGAVFCGLFAPAAVGDYVAGSNHVLPTAGTARFSSALRVSDFLRHVTVVSLDQAALARVAPHILAIAEVEGLEAHGLSVSARARPYAGLT